MLSVPAKEKTQLAKKTATLLPSLNTCSIITSLSFIKCLIFLISIVTLHGTSHSPQIIFLTARESVSRITGNNSLILQYLSPIVIALISALSSNLLDCILDSIPQEGAHSHDTKYLFHKKSDHIDFWVLKFHHNLANKALETSKRDLIPSPPSSLGMVSGVPHVTMVSEPPGTSTPPVMASSTALQALQDDVRAVRTQLAVFVDDISKHFETGEL
ncbi:hypothetical protein H5410_031387 [Solanum commersonii]|uniref:Uncharacterized protein n=1 Tax=Solanum commersonii TaxID=4109 RepID=A0A9J5YI91_SOLCO|nr:hypothetical protein H5410_031387 [Solanum commersonii]